MTSQFDLEDLRRWAQPLGQPQFDRALQVRDLVASRLKRIDENWPTDLLEVFLQGSTVNNTAVEGSSDVDVAVVWCGNYLEADPDLRRTAIEATYSELIGAIGSIFATGTFGEFALRTKDFFPTPVDVVPAIRQEKDGLAGFVVPGGTDLSLVQFKSWPMLHSTAIDSKDRRTKGLFRPVVRVLKGLRDFRSVHTGYSTMLPSYLLESLAAAAPAPLYTRQLEVSASNVIDWAAEITKDSERRPMVPTPDGLGYLFAGHQKWVAPEVRSALVELSGVLVSMDAFG